jgi:hypothetical protein
MTYHDQGFRKSSEVTGITGKKFLLAFILQGIPPSGGFLASIDFKDIGFFNISQNTSNMCLYIRSNIAAWNHTPVIIYIN